MKLLTKELRKKLPALKSTDGQDGDAIAYVKLFSPYTNWTWYVTEFDGQDELFGLVVGYATELGTFFLRELEDLEGAAGLKLVERDLYWKPMPLREIPDAPNWLKN